MAEHSGCRSMIGMVLLVTLWSTSSAADAHNTADKVGTSLPFGRRRAPTAKVAMALQGGGFRAHCTDTGLFAGLLKFVGEQQNIPNATFTNTRLLDRFDTFSTNSGSTWFFSELIYSESFRKLVESMAASPEEAGALFNDRFFDPFKEATHVNPSMFNPKRSIAEWLVAHLLGRGDEDTIFGMQYILATNSTWNEFVQILLKSTSSINRNMTLSSPVDTWANGKYWLIDHTVLLPSKHHRGFVFANDVPLGNSSLDFYQTATYYADPACPNASHCASIPLLVPAKFSMTLGEGPKASAPFPYIASTAVPNLEGFTYQGVAFPLLQQPYAKSGPVDPADLADKALVSNVGSLPIWGVASASSAFGGDVAALGLLVNQLTAKLHHADLTPWVARTPNGTSFTAAEELVANMKKPFGVRKHANDALASAAVHGVIDGGFSDGSGLGNAVAAGAKEVTLVMNSAADCNSHFLEYLCKDGPKPFNPLQPRELYPLFETTAAEVVKAWSAFDRLKLPNTTKYLQRLSAGTMRITTTDNKYWGFEGGRTVTLHIVHVCSNLNMGFFEQYRNFGLLSQEIAMAINAEDNEAFVKSRILPMVAGHASDGSIATPIII